MAMKESGKKLQVDKRRGRADIAMKKVWESTNEYNPGKVDIAMKKFRGVQIKTRRD